jgi:hypothetical protein
MADIRKLIQKAADSMSEAEQERLVQNVKAHLLGGTINIPITRDNGRGGVESLVITEVVKPSPLLYQYLFQMGFGKPAVAEPEPQSADPFRELDEQQRLTDEEINSRLKIAPAPPDEFVEDNE